MKQKLETSVYPAPHCKVQEPCLFTNPVSQTRLMPDEEQERELGLAQVGVVTKN